MADVIDSDKVQQILDRVRDDVRREECWTCDCLQGFLTQLELDSEPAAADLIKPLNVPSAQMHGCLGCDPCPPGAAFADYLQGLNQITTSQCSEQSCGCMNKKESASHE